MAESKWDKSHWMLVAVAVLVLGVVVAKQTTKSEAKRSPSPPVKRAADNPIPRTAAAVAPQHPEAKPTPARPTLPATPPRAAAKAPTPVTPSSAPASNSAPARPTTPLVPPEKPAAEPPTPAAQEPVKMAEPIPGSRFADCLKSGRPTIADFGAGWCKACKLMEPVLKEAAGKHGGKLNIVFVNTDEYPQVAKEYGIRAIPTQVFLDRKGKEVGRHMGYYPLAEFEADMQRFGVIE